MGEKTKKPQTRQKALYRKHRSRSFDEIKGQEHITKTLSNAINQGMISHAYLFTGPRGVGKTSIARILAHEINQLPYEGESLHLDIIEIDAASNRRIDDIRELRDKVHIAPVSAKYKVYIIDEVHMLTTESFNALLKTLEEPPEHVVFILATTEVHKLPATIISRTQRHSFKSIPANEISQHLKEIAKTEDITITDQAIQLLAEHSEGSFRDSISLLDQISGSAEKIDHNLVELLLGVIPATKLEKLLQATLAGQGAAVLSHIESLIEGGITPSAIALQLVKLLRRKLQQDGVLDARLVSLMKELLSIPSAAYQKLRLETLLISVAAPDEATPNSTPPKPSAATISPPVIRKEVEEPVKTTSSKKSQETTSPKVETVESDPKTKTLTTPQSLSPPENLIDMWPEILLDVKKRNSPLYTILRLAEPSLSDNQLVLAFGFEFHRRRVDDSKHKVIVSEAVEAITKTSIEVATTLDKKLANTKPDTSQSAASADPAHASLVANIQDIMGGGDIVNV